MRITHMLFPPYLSKGSKDDGPNGPVRKLQEALVEFFPGLAKKLGLIVDGDYGDKTELMVIALQDVANSDYPADSDKRLELDGNFGPATRKLAWGAITSWPLNCGELEFFAGGECRYLGPDSPEPQLWNPLAETLVETEGGGPHGAAGRGAPETATSA